MINNQSGIYVYCNLINGKKYVGQSVDIERRIKEHNYNINKALKFPIYEALRKYGGNFFIIKILYPIKDLDVMEKYYISFFNTYKMGYNCDLGGKGSRGYKFSEEVKNVLSENQKGINNTFYGKRHSDSTRLKMSQKKSGENHHLYGKSRSEEVKLKISKAKKGKKSHLYGTHHSEEHKRKIGESNKGKKLSSETREKISIALKGRIPWNRGLKMSNNAKNVESVLKE